MAPLNKLFKIALVIGAAAAAGGCASAGTAGTSFTTVDHPGSHPIALRVHNYNWQDVRIYFVPENGARQVRLATIGSFTSRTIPLRGQITASLRASGAARFVIRPLGSRQAHTTEPLVVRPGDAMELTVESRLNYSTLILASR